MTELEEIEEKEAVSDIPAHLEPNPRQSRSTYILRFRENTHFSLRSPIGDLDSNTTIGTLR